MASDAHHSDFHAAGDDQQSDSHVADAQMARVADGTQLSDDHGDEHHSRYHADDHEGRHLHDKFHEYGFLNEELDNDDRDSHFANQHRSHKKDQ